ncbi:STAS domain-containing protein [Mucisphaera sp.]|uniref:STAS domain-containing protein n=1 Tax=Mucisphaera sp. TaxID=2913024 RepID=UPI003D100DFE
MEITQSQVGAVGVLTLKGALVGDAAGTLREAAEPMQRKTMGRMVLDLAAVPFIDSQSLEALLDLTEAMSASGRVLKLAAANALIREVLSLTDLDGHFEHYLDVNAAARSFL